VATLNAVTLAPRDYPEWSGLVARSPDGCIYAQPEYLEALCTATGGGFRIIGVRRGDELAGGVALYETDSGVLGRRAGPRLLLYYHSPVLAPYAGGYPSLHTARDLEVLGALADHVAGLGYDAIALKCRSTVRDVRPFLARGWSAHPSYTYVVPLTDLAAQWERVEQNLRRLIKRCTERDGLVLTDDRDFDAFFRLHALTLERRGTGTYLPEPAFRRFFETLHAAGLARLYHARLPDGAVIATQLVLLGSHPVSHTVCAGMDPEHARLGAPAFLRWKAFEELARLGYRANDLTDAALNSVTHFKSQLGGDLECALVVESPRSLRAVAGGALQSGVARARGLAGGALRRVLRTVRR
jgi:hypothetical protein